jgi:nucleotide-binding universal stress UspA family protein
MPPTIIAYIGDGPRYWPLIERAIDLAASRKAGLILYDVDGASPFSSPRPNEWSSEGLAEQFQDRLSPQQLEKAGREELRDRVIHARDRGIETWGWLPKKRDAQTLGEYAAQQGASLVVIPTQLEKHGLLDMLRGRPSADEIVEETDSPVLEVDLEPEAAKT